VYRAPGASLLPTAIMPMKAIASMPAMAGAKFQPLSTRADRSNLKRSASAVTHKPQERMRQIAKRVPFYAYAGMGAQLTTFARSYSRANLARSMSRNASAMNINQRDYGSTRDPQLPSPTGSLSREQSETLLFGTIFQEDELEMMQPGWTWSLGMAVFTAVLASFQVGYNSGVLNVPQNVIVSSLKLTTIQWSIAVSIFCIGGLLGSMSGGRFADSIGRKNFLIANNVAFIGGGLLQALASSFIMLSAGRLLIGIGCGGATVVVPMYLGEIAPANLRGSLGTMNQFSMVVGILVANLLGKPLGGFESWRYLLGLCLFPALIQTILAATLLESPLWLVLQGGQKNRAQAEEVLSRLRGTDDVEFDLECMVAEAEGAQQEDDEDDEDGWNRSFQGSSNDLFAEESQWSNSSRGKTEKLEKGSLRKDAAVQEAQKHAQEESAARSSLFHADYRRPLLVGFGLQLAQQFSGINAVFFYSTMFFASAHMSDPWMGSVLASAVNVLATGFSIYLIERTGRRPLLLISTAGMMLSCVGLTFALMSNLPSSTGVAPPAWVGVMSIVMVLVFVAFFEIGLGPIPWLIGSEIFPRAIRTQAMGVSSTINWLSNFAVGLCFPTISIVLGPMAFVPFATVLLGALILMYFYVPETQGKSLEEIQDEFVLSAEEAHGEDAIADEHLAIAHQNAIAHTKHHSSSSSSHAGHHHTHGLSSQKPPSASPPATGGTPIAEGDEEDSTGLCSARTERYAFPDLKQQGRQTHRDDSSSGGEAESPDEQEEEDDQHPPHQEASRSYSNASSRTGDSDAAYEEH
jgi:SP family facilitated glucose transporter-like MFS transporter 3